MCFIVGASRLSIFLPTLGLLLTTLHGHLKNPRNANSCAISTFHSTFHQHLLKESESSLSKTKYVIEGLSEEESFLVSEKF